MTEFQDCVANMVTSLQDNWSTNSGGVIPTVIDQGQNYQIQDLMNKEYVLVFGTTNSIEPFDFMWASRLRKQRVIIQCFTGSTRDRLIQIVSEVLRIMLTPSLFTKNVVNVNIDAVPDLSQTTKLWFQMNIEGNFWLPETS